MNQGAEQREHEEHEMRLAIVDISGLCHAAWHASAGQAVNGMRETVLSRVRGYLNGSNFDRVAICCDAPGKKFRHDIDPEYKATRGETDAGLHEQIRQVIATLDADGCHIFEAASQEADDCAASIVAWNNSACEFHDVVLVSDDKDWAAMVRDAPSEQAPSVALYRPRKGETVNVDGVVKMLGVAPSQVTDWLSLTGDTSDNIPGVKGVGPKKATDLLTAFGNLEGISDALINNATKFSQSLATNLRDTMEAGLVAAKSRALVQLNHNALTHDDCAALLKKKEVRPMTTTTDAEWESSPGQSSPPESHETATAVPVAVASEPRPSAVAPNSSERTAELAIRSEQPFNQTLEPMTPQEAWKMSHYIFNSRLFSNYGNPEAVLATALMGRSLGIDMMSALRGLHIIKGKPVMSAQLMQGLVMRSGHCKYFQLVESTDAIATYATQRIGDPKPVEMSFTIEDAQRAKLTGGSDSNWTKYPRTMLRWRCVAELAKAVYPDILAGCYVPEDGIGGEA